MNTAEAASALYACLGFLALTAFWCLGWKPWALDMFRQDLYAARDRLFDLASENHGGAFSFDHLTYAQLRRQFHGAIRYAHRVSTLRVLIFLVGQFILGPRIKLKSIEDKRHAAVRKVDETAQPAILEVTKMWDRALGKYLALTSPLFIFCVACGVVWLILKAVFHMMLKSFVMRFAVSEASAPFSSVVWAEVAIADAIEEERMGRLAHAA